MHCALQRGEVVLVPVEAKSRRDSLVRHQIAKAVGRLQALTADGEPLGLKIRPVGLKALGQSEILLAEFNETANPDKLIVKRLRKYLPFRTSRSLFLHPSFGAAGDLE